MHRRDLAEQISRIVGQKTVTQTSYSYGEGRRSRQVSKTGQSILDTDEIAHLCEDETVVLVEGLRPLVGEKLRYYRDKTFKRRRSEALPLPAPLTGALPDAPGVSPESREARSGESGGTIEPASPVYASAESVRIAIDDIPQPPGCPSPDELQRMAEALAQITHHADPQALAAFAAQAA